MYGVKATFASRPYEEFWITYKINGGFQVWHEDIDTPMLYVNFPIFPYTSQEEAIKAWQLIKEYILGLEEPETAYLVEYGSVTKLNQLLQIQDGENDNDGP